jgi:hypothetical protein
VELARTVPRLDAAATGARAPNEEDVDKYVEQNFQWVPTD